MLFHYILLQFNCCVKSDKMPYIIYPELESLIKEINECANNPKNLQQKKQVNIFLADIQCQQYGLLII